MRRGSRPFARGFFALADRHAVDLVGGDTTRGPLNLCITLLGEVPAGQAVLRSGAKPGDDVYVSGTLGRRGARAGRVNGESLSIPRNSQRAAQSWSGPSHAWRWGGQLRGVAERDDRRFGWAHRRPRAHPRRINCRAVPKLVAIPHSPVLGSRLTGSEHRQACSACWPAATITNCAFTAPAAAGPRIAAIAREVALH